jgi:DNA repair ATPase RecN
MKRRRNVQNLDLQRTTSNNQSVASIANRSQWKYLFLLSVVSLTVMHPKTLAFQCSITQTTPSSHDSTRIHGRLLPSSRQFLSASRPLHSTKNSSEENDVPFHDTQKDVSHENQKTKSRIRQIRCQNLAGMSTGNVENAEIVLNLDRNPSDTTDLIAITGETGSGKSLLIGRVADLVTGGKASVSMIHDYNMNKESSATAEMTLVLQSSHRATVSRTLERHHLDPTTILQGYELTFTRVLSRSGPRLKSSCYLNAVPVPLKVLKAVGSPLLALVNAPAAAAALNKPASRLLMLDTGIPTSVLQWVRQLQASYRKARQYRQSLELELAQHHLPLDSDRDLDLLKHWVEELDGFHGRISNVRNSVATSNIAVDDDDCNMATIIANLEATEWTDSDGSTSSSTFSSSMYRLLLDLLDETKSLDRKIASAMQAKIALSSLSAPDSAYTALDRARKLLLDATQGMQDDKSKVARSAEKTHELLNLVEDALLECGTFLEDDEKSLVATLEETRRRCSLSSEDLLEYITEWNTLARKHGITPYQLPSCHSSLRKELEGGVEARILLPKAVEAEKKAMRELEEGCQVLTDARSTLCGRISRSITERLPLLGMGNSRFEARVRRINAPTYGASHLGVDEVDFFLFHGNKIGQLGSTRGSDQNGDGKLENVASSGEKARLLLAIECMLPGSVRALCGTTSDSDLASSEDESTLSPVAVIYDEIDAHVGGRASISVAQMLVDQSKSCQVLSITHSPSLAALADTHICVTKTATNGHHSSICVKSVDGLEREKELARMASGDMASEEAELFAKALLRDASLQGRRSNATAITT